MELTILGASPAVPNPGGACSGYLLRQGESRVLVDCGSGVVGRLRQHVEPHTLAAVVISHLHADHYFDLSPLYYALRFAPRRADAKAASPEADARERGQGESPRATDERGSPASSRAASARAAAGPGSAGRSRESSRAMPLFVPPGGREHLRRLARMMGGREVLFEQVFDVREYVPGGATHALGEFGFTFHPVQHYVPSHAMRIQGADGGLLVFSSDVGPCAELVEAAQGAQTLLCEAAILKASDDPDQRRRGHLTAEEAGHAAREAGVKRLILTHCRRDGGVLDAQQLESARASFQGPVELADEGRTFHIG